MIRRAAALALLLSSGVVGAQEPVVRLQDPGPGPGPELLARELARPHIVIPPATQRAVLARGHAYPSTVIVLGRDVVVDGRVEGDVIVVAGDLYVHPGAAVAGRLMAFGGGVYESMLATSAGMVAYRDFTYDITPEQGGFALSYRQLIVQAREQFAFTGPSGVGLPSYDRTNGLSLPLGPDFAVHGQTLILQPRLTYRSQLGRLDPSLAIEDSLNRRTTIRLWAGRGSFSNDRWIWSDPVNSIEYLAFGHDSRNWFRASRAELTATRRWEGAGATIEPYAGLRIERATSTRPAVGATSAPWTFGGRHDPDDALRPNPPITGTASRSLLAGVRWQWTGGDIAAHLRADGELGNADASCSSITTCRPLTSITQLTLDGGIRFPTFGTQSLQFETHVVASGSRTPRERYAYLGGPGSLPTIDMLELGGNELVFVNGRYDIPMAGLSIPVLGTPVLSVREVLAGAAVDRWPTLRQAVGARVAVDLLYGELLVDPLQHRGDFSVGLAIAR